MTQPFVVWSQPIAAVDDALRLVEASYERQARAFLLDGSLLPPSSSTCAPASRASSCRSS